jgi:hypothetical protein
MKHRKGVRRKGIRWEYNGDGMFARERIKGVMKRYWRRWTRRVGKSESVTPAASIPGSPVDV